VSRASTSFRSATLAVLDARPPGDRKRLGQFFTPRAVRQRLLDHVALAAGMRVLDPGAGTGEFLLDALERQPGLHVEGWDIDPELVRVCREEHGLRGVHVHDALAGPSRPQFDVVIGNPPYYEVRGRADLTARFADVVSGRPNVFAMFFQAALASLVQGGRLAFVVPPSMNNGAYFAALRAHVLEHASIEHLEVLDDPLLFDGARQSVMLIVLRKRPGDDRFVHRVDLGRARPTPIFVPDPARLKALLAGSRRLIDLGYVAKTGRCVWNQRRGDLRTSAVPGAVALIRPHHIVDRRIVLDAPSRTPRPSYVIEPSPDVGPAIAVNRVVGTVGAARIRAGLIPEGMAFVGENHVNIVQRDAGAPRGAVAPIEHVLDGLCAARAVEAVRLLTGNTQLSATELTYLVPVGAPAR